MPPARPIIALALLSSSYFLLWGWSSTHLYPVACFVIIAGFALEPTYGWWRQMHRRTMEADQREADQWEADQREADQWEADQWEADQREAEEVGDCDCYSSGCNCDRPWECPDHRHCGESSCQKRNKKKFLATIP